jgi:RNA polymerase sigma-70 factor (ECF subfamily)
MDRYRDLFWKQLEPEHRRARAYCHQLTGNRDDGDDLYQDSLVYALRGFARLRDHDSFRAWLYRIIINTFKNRVKQPWWKRVVPLGRVEAESAIGDNPGPRRAARRRLEIAFRAISPEDRALVTLFELEGWTAEEIAEVTGKAAVTVRVQVKRARDRMRQELIRYFEKNGSGPCKLSRYEDKVCVVQKPAKE